MKQIINVTQGSPEWLKLRSSVDITASEAAAALGLSKYMTRSELLHMKSTGEVPGVDANKQRIFDKGHEVEALARPIAEAIIGEELYPATITNEVEGLLLLASMDGLTMMQDAGWEHKLFNAELATMVSAGEVPDTHWPQLEQQLLVAECDSIYFTVSDGTEENMVSTQYVSIPERRKQLVEGLKQFKADLANYVPTAKAEKVSAEPVRDLPAITYKMNGLSLVSNLDDYKSAANQLVEKSRQVIETDQDFANAEARQKVFTKAEKEISDLCDRVLGEVADIDSFTKDLKYIGAQIREARLSEAKQITKRKDDIRLAILTDAKREIDAAINDAELRIECRLPNLTCDVMQAMKGKKTIDSLKDAAATEVANGKIEVTNYLNTALSNMATIRELAPDHKRLFNDWPNIAFKANDDFTAVVKTRLIDEQARIDAERAKIRAEEEAKATAAAEAKLRAEQAEIARKQQAEQAEAERIERENQSKLKAEQAAITRTTETQSKQLSEEAEALREMQQSFSEQEIANQPERVEQRQIIGTASRVFVPSKPTTAASILQSYNPIGDRMPSDDIRMGNALITDLCNQIMKAESTIFQAKQLMNRSEAA